MPNTSIYMQKENQGIAAVTYYLQTKNNSRFYQQLASFTDKMLKEADFFLNKEIQAVVSFFSEEYPEKTKNTHELIVEYLALGIYIDTYAGYAVNSGSWATSGMGYLYSLRRKSKRLKPIVDNVRGVLSAHLLYSKKLDRVSYTKESLYKLVSWMKASGEFKEESERMEQWAFYLSTLDEAYIVSFIARCVAFAKYFEEQAKFYLGEYTKGVNIFLSEKHADYKYREDYLFCGRSEAEYHLNMFGAEILNRVLKEQFDQTENKILLLPTCMAQPVSGTCKATQVKNYFSCSGCTKSCRVNQITQQMKQKECETVLVPHSSSFSEFLKNWQNQSTTGLIGVACVLNLLTGGYEMQKLNIPSQCVFLDYSGCKKHWHSSGIPTDLNTEQLHKLLEPVKEKSYATNA